MILDSRIRQKTLLYPQACLPEDDEAFEVIKTVQSMSSDFFQQKVLGSEAAKPKDNCADDDIAQPKAVIETKGVNHADVGTL